MLIIPFLILLLFFGFELTLILKAKMGLVERLSVSCILGIGIFTFFVFLFDWIFNIDYSLNNTISLLVSLCAVLFAVKYRETINFFKNFRIKKEPLKAKTIIFWAFIFLIVAYTLLINLYWPISDWDALALYDFRAKVFLVDKNLIHAALANGYFIQYPLLTSLAHLFVYQMGLPNPKFIYSLFYLSFICIFYFSLIKHVSENKAMFFTVVFALVPEFLAHSMMAYTNLPYVIYFCSGIFYLYDWIKDRKLSSLLLSGLLVGLSCWVRITEPFWMVPLFIVIAVSIKRKSIKEIFYYLIPVYGFYKIWLIFMSNIAKLLSTGQPTTASSVVNGYLSILRMFTPDRITTVAGYLYKNVFSTWGLILLLFILVTIWIFINKRNNQSTGFLYITLIFFVFLFVGTICFSIVYPAWQEIPDSARRMSMLLLPLMIYSISLSF